MGRVEREGREGVVKIRSRIRLFLLVQISLKFYALSFFFYIVEGVSLPPGCRVFVSGGVTEKTVDASGANGVLGT